MIDPVTGLEVPDQAQQSATAQAALQTLPPSQPIVEGPQLPTSMNPGDQLQTPTFAPAPEPAAPPPPAAAIPIVAPPPVAPAAPQPAPVSLATLGPPPVAPAEDRTNPEKSAQAFADYRAKLLTYNQQLQSASGAVADEASRKQLDVAQKQVNEGLRYAGERHQKLADETKARADDARQLQSAIDARKQAMQRGQESYWDTTSTGQKIAAAFMVAAGAFGAGLQNA